MSTLSETIAGLFDKVPAQAVGGTTPPLQPLQLRKATSGGYILTVQDKSDFDGLHIVPTKLYELVSKLHQACPDATEAEWQAAFPDIVAKANNDNNVE